MGCKFGVRFAQMGNTHSTDRAYSRKKGHAGDFAENVQDLQNLKIFWKRAASCVRLSHVWNS